MTREQHRTLTFIGDYTRAHGYSPSYDEIAGHLGIASKSGVVRLVDALQALGKLRRAPGRSRSLEVVGQAPADLSELALRLTDALKDAHGMDDGEGLIICATEDEAYTVLLAALSR